MKSQTRRRVSRHNGGHIPLALVSLRITITIAREGSLVARLPLSRGKTAWHSPRSTATCWNAACNGSQGRGRILLTGLWAWWSTWSTIRPGRAASAWRPPIATTSARKSFWRSIKNDFAVLRNFRGKSSLATYLTVVARRIVVKELLARMSAAQLGDGSSPHAAEGVPDPHPSVEERLGDQEEVERLLGGLQGTEAQVVRMYHLEGKSYHEISAGGGHARKQHRPDPQPSAQQDAPRERRFRRNVICYGSILMSDQSNSPCALLSAANEIEAAGIVTALAEYGIVASTTRRVHVGHEAEAPGKIQVLVRRPDLDRAKLALAEIQQDEGKIDWSEDSMSGHPEE